MQTWFITGASRGFGLEVARLALDRGDAVVAAARTLSGLEEAFGGPSDRLLVVSLDVTNEAQAEAAVQSAVSRFGSIDVLINNAGRGFGGAVEEATDDEARATFDVNFFGLLSVTRTVLPTMRRQRSGRIVNMSSVGGFIAGPGTGIYAATKFAVEAVSEALQAELAPLGIQVILIEPGGFRTDFFDPSSMVFAERVIEDYASTAGAFRGRAVQNNHLQAGDPKKAALAIVDAATISAPPFRLVLGTGAMTRMEGKLRTMQTEIDAWRHVSISTEVNC
jgi:NAD(P)-dependent dehydrogenase (short-subunit alcohol dehydrogenase family)